MRRWIASVAVGLTAAVSLSVVPTASALPLAPAPVVPVTGIPAPCASTVPFPEKASIDELKAGITEHFGFQLAGTQWTEQRRASIKILWQTLDALECTTYRKDLQAKVERPIGINATDISGYAWGDWSLTKPYYVSFDFSKFQRALDSGDEGRLVRLVTHELAHALNYDRGSDPAYWVTFQKLFAKEGRFSSYAGSSVTETFADVVGYYVGRCAFDNPYDTGKFDAYYEYAKTYVFGGKEFGPAPGQKINCEVPTVGAEAPMPGAEAAPEWLEGLSGE